MIDIDWMVSWLVQLMQDAYLAVSLGSSREHGIAEMVFRHYL